MANHEYATTQESGLKQIIEGGMVMADLGGIAFGVATGNPVIATLSFVGLLTKLFVF